MAEINGKGDGPGSEPERPILPEPDAIGDLTSEQASALILAGTAWLARPKTQKALRSALHPTATFLLMNESIMTPEGNVQKRQRWFDNSKFDVTDNWLQLQMRQASLRRMAFGHGVMRLFDIVESDGHLPENAHLYFDQVTNLAPIQVCEVLLNRKLSNGKPLKLDDLNVCFNYGREDDTKPVRNRWVVPMALLGLLTAVPGNPYVITLGPVADLFYECVFEPVVKAFDDVLKSEMPSRQRPSIKPPNINYPSPDRG